MCPVLHMVGVLQCGYESFVAAVTGLTCTNVFVLNSRLSNVNCITYLPYTGYRLL